MSQNQPARSGWERLASFLLLFTVALLIRWPMMWLKPWLPRHGHGRPLMFVVGLVSVTVAISTIVQFHNSTGLDLIPAARRRSTFGFLMGVGAIGLFLLVLAYR